MASMSSQENLKIQRESFLSSKDHSREIGIIFFVISVLAHGLFFAGMIYFQDFRLPKPMPPVIQVDLVSFAPEPLLEDPGKKKEVSTKEGVAVKVKPVKKKKRKIPTIKADISLKTKPKNLKDLMAQQKEKKKEPGKKVEKKKTPEKKTTPGKN